MGKVGRDSFGKEMVELIDKEKVGSRGVKVFLPCRAKA